MPDVVPRISSQQHAQLTPFSLTCQMRVFDEKRIALSAEDADRRGNEDKRKLFERFQLEELIEHKQRESQALFDNRCFKRGSQRKLHVHYHIPQVLGGREAALPEFQFTV